MLSKGQLFTGGLYTRESWDEYWEGSLKRDNDNIGTVTTQVNTWYANYGVTNRLNVIGAVPYVWTRASQGVLHGIDGFQDLTLAAKYTMFERGLLRGAEGGGLDLPALRRHSLSLRPRSRQGAREANRRVHRQICEDRRRRRSLRPAIRRGGVARETAAAVLLSRTMPSTSSNAKSPARDR